MEQDNAARAYIVRSLMGYTDVFTKPVLAICLPVSAAASWVLYSYDTERPNAWITALVAVPILLIAIRMYPYIYMLFRDRWIIDGNSIRMRGSVVGRVEGRELTGWRIRSAENLPGYYHLSIATKKTSESILISEANFPVQEVRGEMEKRFGEQAAAPNRSETPNLNSMPSARGSEG